TRKRSGHLAVNAAGFSNGLGRGAVAAPLVAVPFGADLGGAGVCARTAVPDTRRMSRPFIRVHFTQCAIPHARGTKTELDTRTPHGTARHGTRRRPHQPE